MSAPRFMLGLKATGRLICMRKMATKCFLPERILHDISADEIRTQIEMLRAEMLQFVSSSYFDEYVITTMGRLRDPEYIELGDDWS